MDLTILGCGGTWPGKGGACSGYLVREDGFNLWIDLGTGTLANLQRTIDLLDVDAVIVSHAHPDHFVDLYPYFYARLFDPSHPSALPLFTPPGAFDRIASLLSGSGAGIDNMRRVFDARTVEPGEQFRAGPFTVRTQPMCHTVPTLGMRLEGSDGATLAYSADTGPTDELVDLAWHTDLLLSEATMGAEQQSRDPIHLTGRQAGEHAARAGTGRLVLTHLWPSTDRDRVRLEAASAYDGPLELAAEGMEVTI